MRTELPRGDMRGKIQVHPKYIVLKNVESKELDVFYY